MFPDNSTSNSNLGNSSTTKFFYSDSNNSTSFDSSTTFPPIHSPYIFNEDDLQHLHDFLQYQQQLQSDHQETTHISANYYMEDQLVEGSTPDPAGDHDAALCSYNNKKKQTPRRRTSNKDRHSKINTAHGPRDRRMRLSLDVAQKFFGLQDKLGFDKASKTVQWLLTKSKTAIKKLSNTKGGNAPNTASSSSTSINSECEVLSGIIDESAAPVTEINAATEKAKPAVTRDKKATSSTARGSRAYRPLAKEAREKARARARERTEEKRNKFIGSFSNNYDHQSKKVVGIDQNLNRNLASWVPFEAAGEEESSTQIQIAKKHPSFLQEPTSGSGSGSGIGSTSQQGNIVNTAGGWSPCPFFNYHHNAGVSHEHCFAEAQYFGKPWDDQTYSN